MLVAVFDARASDAPPPGEPPAREWFVVEEYGRRRARGLVTRRRLSGGLTETVEDRETRREREGILYVTRERLTLETTAEGLARRRERVFDAGGRVYSEKIVVDAERRRVRYESGAPGATARVPLSAPADLRFGLDACDVPGLLAAQGRAPAPGARLEVPILDIADWRVAAETVEIMAVGVWRRLSRPPAPEPAPELWPPEFPVVDALSRTGDGEAVRMIFTSGGRLLWMGRPDGTMAWRAVPRAEHDRDADPAEIVTRLSHGRHLPAWDAYDRLDFRLAPAADWRGLVPAASEYARLVDDPAGNLAAVLTVPDRLDGDRPPPPGAWLSETGAIPFRHPAVVRAAREADRFRDFPDAPGPRAAISAALRLEILARWVRRTITAPNTKTMVMGPVETLAERRGHCGEHARLLIALCRYWGIPARLCQGLTVRADDLVYHAWVEAWTGDAWTPVDTTAGTVIRRAGYWLTRRESPDGALEDPLPSVLQGGGLRVSWLAAGVADPDGEWHFWHAGQDEPPVARKGEGAFDLGWGVGLWRPPAGWRFTPETPDGIDWRQGRALRWSDASGTGLSFRMQAWPGTFRPTEWVLRERSTALTKGLARFRRATGGTAAWPGDAQRGLPGPEALRLDFRWRADDGRDAWARQWEVPGAERKARVTFEGTGEPGWTATLGTELAAATRLR